MAMHPKGSIETHDDYRRLQQHETVKSHANDQWKLQLLGGRTACQLQRDADQRTYCILTGRGVLICATVRVIPA